MTRFVALFPRPFTSAGLDENRYGTFTCAGCERELVASEKKGDVGTGCRASGAPVDKAVDEVRDTSFGMARTAVHCSRCGAHLGHVFNDDPSRPGRATG